MTEQTNPSQSYYPSRCPGAATPILSGKAGSKPCSVADVGGERDPLAAQPSSVRVRDVARAMVLMARALWAWKVRRDHRKMTDLLARATTLLYPGRSGMVRSTKVPYRKEFGR